MDFLFLSPQNSVTTLGAITPNPTVAHYQLRRENLVWQLSNAFQEIAVGRSAEIAFGNYDYAVPRFRAS